jgi:hypothetical protein
MPCATVCVCSWVMVGSPCVGDGVGFESCFPSVNAGLTCLWPAVCTAAAASRSKTWPAGVHLTRDHLTWECACELDAGVCACGGGGGGVRGRERCGLGAHANIESSACLLACPPARLPACPSTCSQRACRCAMSTCAQRATWRASRGSTHAAHRKQQQQRGPQHRQQRRRKMRTNRHRLR